MLCSPVYESGVGTESGASPNFSSTCVENRGRPGMVSWGSRGAARRPGGRIRAFRGGARGVARVRATPTITHHHPRYLWMVVLVVVLVVGPYIRTSGGTQQASKRVGPA